MEHSIIPKAPLKHTVYVSHHHAFVNQKKNGDQNTNEWVIYKRFQIRRLIILHIHSPYNSYYLLNAVKEDIRAQFVDYFEVLIQDDYLESGSKMTRVTFQGISFYRRCGVFMSGMGNVCNTQMDSSYTYTSLPCWSNVSCASGKLSLFVLRCAYLRSRRRVRLNKFQKRERNTTTMFLEVLKRINDTACCLKLPAG